MSELNQEIVVLGTGPAGLQAAIHAARAKASVLVLGRPHKSSLFRAHVENYCCLSSVPGQTILEEGRRQAEGSGALFREEDVIDIEPGEGGFAVHLEGGDLVRCRSLVLAMGISRNTLKVKGEKELLGRGVSYCVDCDAGFFRGEPVAVAGCGSAAASGALTLLFYASQVHLICEELQINEVLAQKIRESSIVLHEGRQVRELGGENKLEGLTLDDGQRLEVSGLFIELGAKGALELAGKLGIDLDPESFKFIAVDKKQQTNLPGVYAAGDICGPPWQMAKAVGEGCVAGLEAAAYVKKLRK